MDHCTPAQFAEKMGNVALLDLLLIILPALLSLMLILTIHTGTVALREIVQDFTQDSKFQISNPRNTEAAEVCYTSRFRTLCI